ncbi:hypothetical protein SCHPADRAFT_749652 [Schizopora paradoxa]|uniref:Uncharacterized protein n=1 Tax=Schizopora paradoxa TaxID=27342 RepID=A0A0H2QYY5_9AGAM|nr:hypothetical protein SCHPADRAFT_749652 [Schizopora paradoxa]
MEMEILNLHVGKHSFKLLRQACSACSSTRSRSHTYAKKCYRRNDPSGSTATEVRFEQFRGLSFDTEISLHRLFRSLLFPSVFASDGDVVRDVHCSQSCSIS